MTLLCFGAMAQQKKGLFVGNSYTEVNNLPQLVGQVCENMRTPISYSSNTPGGCTFNQHCSNQSMDLICQGGWDVVVLQEQSQYPSFPQNQVESEVFPFAKRLVDSVYAYSPCCEPMFYMTWGRKNGDERNAPYFPVLGTYEGMDSMLYERYMYMGRTDDAAVSPVGRVWRYLRANNPEIELYQADESHPSMAGSYAAAVTFYVMIFENSPLGITWNSTIDPEVAATIRNAVKTVVYDNLDFWKRPRPQANFTWSVNNGNFSVSNLSQNATDYTWIWGDGTTSEGNQTTHNYAEDGTYQVTLIASRHCMSDTIKKEVSTTAGAVGIVAAENMVNLYPNPTNGKLRIEARGFIKTEVMDCAGKVVLPYSTDNTINLEKLPQGVYLVRIVTNDNILTEKVVKQ